VAFLMMNDSKVVQSFLLGEIPPTRPTPFCSRSRQLPLRMTSENILDNSRKEGIATNSTTFREEAELPAETRRGRVRKRVLRGAHHFAQASRLVEGLLATPPFSMRVHVPLRHGGRSIARAAQGVAKGAKRVVLRGRFAKESGENGGEDVVEFLYPTFASRDHEDPSRWRVRVHGTIVQPGDVRVDRLASVMKLLRYFQVHELEPGTHAHSVFLRRVGGFVVRNRQGRSVMVKCCAGKPLFRAKNTAQQGGEEEEEEEEEEEGGAGVARISTTVSDRCGHFRSEDWVHDCELPSGVSAALRSSSSSTGATAVHEEGEARHLPTVPGAQNATAPGAPPPRLDSSSGRRGNLVACQKLGAPLELQLRVVKEWSNPFAPSCDVDLGDLCEVEETEDTPEVVTLFDGGGGGEHGDDGGGQGELLEQEGSASLGQEVGVGAVYFIPPYGWSVISDIDDTVKITGVVGVPRAEMVRNTFMREFVAANGMPRLFQDWASQGAAFHYVSSSPWQLQPELSSFFVKAGLPGGSFHLKDFDVRGRGFFNYFLTPSAKSKPLAIETLLAAFPSRRFVLVGDSGEKDPEIYAGIARAHPEQV